ncbi:hypothetical protein K504DRAFT_457384 [Pleomassaria siparia CBS 279.74]|uniref:Ubiquitin interaction motif protein n=1 Tax=Pleomassaria siparia CBS 279.74 TaxID=1314801 RepID=A0A6G1KQU4_9PLEO|nr:hypothetical protein K504DRAFT_457384 [Pleomassaria siparia CBS 279.74]
MVSRVNEEDVEMLVAITNQLSREQAARFLEISNYSVEEATNKFYDQGISALEAAKVSWDGSAFGATGYQGLVPDESKNPSFSIECVDDYPHSRMQSAAPSRPPSRTSQRSGTSSYRLNDAPLQSIENQEQGVIGGSKTVFGPATKETYDNREWAMVTMRDAEILPDAAPHARKREENGPAIIKPNQNYLPALLTILHSIPLFRNALLTPQVSCSKYWAGEDWWKGSASAAARIIDLTSSKESGEELDLIKETQRLMAFLDISDRAYASLDNLLQLDIWKKSSMSIDDADDEVLKFLLNWSSAYQSHTSQAQLNGILRSMVNARGENQESFLLDAPVIHHDSRAEVTLYDVLDDMLLVGNATAHIVDLSNVLILRLSTSKLDATSLDCKIPAIFYADRYLEGNKSVVDGMILERKQYQDELEVTNEKTQKLKYHASRTTSNPEPLDSLKLLKASMSAFEKRETDLIHDPAHAKVISQLQSVYESIERKINALDDEKNRIRKTLDSISSRFRAPMNDPSGSNKNTMKTMEVDDVMQDAAPEDPSPHSFNHPYKLCGVSTRPNVFYLLHPGIQSESKNWWRIEYATPTTEAYIFREQLTLAQVLEKASSEHGKALLVYANEAATSVPPIPLSTPLVNFVKKDNVKFMEELQTTIGGTNDWTDDGPSTYKPDEPWETRPNAYQGFDGEPGWEDMSAQQFHSRNNTNSGQSSTTLTPNTDDDDVNMEVEQVGGEPAWVGGHSNASSDTVAMEIMESRPEGTVNMRDVEMRDVDSADAEPKERKGG